MVLSLFASAEGSALSTANFIDMEHHAPHAEMYTWPRVLLEVVGRENWQ